MSESSKEKCTLLVSPTASIGGLRGGHLSSSDSSNTFPPLSPPPQAVGDAIGSNTGNKELISQNQHSKILPDSKRPSHIIIANNVYPPIMAGGAELLVQYLAEGLAMRGIRVTVVSTCAPEMEPYPTQNINGVEIIRFFPKNIYWHWTRGKQPAYRKALWHLRDAWNMDAGKKFSKILESHQPDILHTHLLDGFSATLWRQAHKRGIPVVHTAHDYHLLCPRALMLTKSLKICSNPTTACQLYRKWHLHTSAEVDLFCGPSQFIVDKHIEAGLQAKQTKVIANAVPLTETRSQKPETSFLSSHLTVYQSPPPPAGGAGGGGYTATTERCPPLAPPAGGGGSREVVPASGELRENKKRELPIKFLFISRLTREKGCQVLLDAMKLIPVSTPLELLVAGKGEMEEAFISAAGQDNRIKLLGYIKGEEKTKVLSQADCLIIPSLWYENAPLVILEAAANGLGIIGSNIGAIPEFIHEGKTGLLFEPGNAEALADTIMRIIEKPEMLDTFSQAAAKFADRYSVEKMVDAYLEQYTNLYCSRFKN